MAIEYHLFTGLETPELQIRLAEAAREAGACWVAANAKKLGPFDLEILAEYGHEGDFASRAYIRHDKELSVLARTKLQQFFLTLPEPKVVLFQMDPTDQEEFRKLPLDTAG